MYKVLLVEDEEKIRKGLANFFDWKKVNTELIGVATNGEEGFKEIYTKKPDIVITDIRMPHVDGLEMIKRASQIHEFRTIIISGYDEFEYARTALKLSVDEYILKPIDFEELSNAILSLQNKQIQSSSSTYGEAEPFIHYIKSHIDQRIYLDDLCQFFDLSSTTINEIIKEECNMTAVELINLIKVEYATSLLKLNKYKMYEIADMTGFSSYKYFSEVFKKVKQTSPSNYLNDL